MDNLTEEQKASFAANNALVGLGPNEFTVQLSNEEFAVLPTTRIMSSDPDESHFPTHFIEVGSIAEMRKIAGFPENYEETGNVEPNYPPPPSKEEIELVTKDSTGMNFHIVEDLRQNIEKAAQAFVLGNPDKVKAYEPLINAALFPGKVAVFTGGTLEVPAGTLHVIKGEIPVFLNFETIVVGENASFSVQSTFALNSQKFIQESSKGELGISDPNDNYTYKNIGEPFTQPATTGTIGPAGLKGPAGTTNGGSHYDSGSCQYVCDTAPSNGQQGLAPVGSGNNGTNGAMGRKSAGGVYRWGRVTGQVTMLLGGGDGQQGGKGGPGGPGGPGGDPGTAAKGCTDASSGSQGPGGKGGDGGPGGPGGESGFVTIYYSDGGGKISVTVTGCAGGPGGDPGDPGVGVGNLGPGHHGTTGTPPGPIPRYSLNEQ